MSTCYAERKKTKREEREWEGGTDFNDGKNSLVFIGFPYSIIGRVQYGPYLLCSMGYSIWVRQKIGLIPQQFLPHLLCFAVLYSRKNA